MSHVDVMPVRVAVEEHVRRHGLTMSDVAARLGWRKANGAPDVTRLGRALGMNPEGGSHRQHLRSETAAKIVRAIGRAPVDFDF